MGFCGVCVAIAMIPTMTCVVRCCETRTDGQVGSTALVCRQLEGGTLPTGGHLTSGRRLRTASHSA